MKMMLLLSRRKKVKNKTSMQSFKKLRVIRGNPKPREVIIKVPCNVSNSIEVAKNTSGKNILKLF